MYGMKRDFGHPNRIMETRAEYNARFGQPVPDAPQVPFAAGHVEEWFWKLSSRRQYGAGGPSPLSYTEISAWMNTTGTEVRDVEIEMIVAMDAEWLNATADEAARDAQRRDGMAGIKSTGKRGP